MKTVIVDSHKEVLPHWIGEYIARKLPLVVLRIDKHHDMFPDCPLLPAREGRGIFDYLDKMMPVICEYTRRRLNEGNFTCPAFHYGIVGTLYHFDPRREMIDAYGRVCNGELVDAPRTRTRSSFEGGRRVDLIEWDGERTRLRKQNGRMIPAPESIDAARFESDMDESRYPVVIGIDLDGLCAIDDRGWTEKEIEKRLRKARRLLECLSAPVLACIARSQTPRAYVPSELVDELQEAALSLIAFIRLQSPPQDPFGRPSRRDTARLRS